LSLKLQKWIFYIGNLGDQSNLDFVIDLMKRGTRSGYSALVLQDDRLCRIENAGSKYVNNVNKLLKNVNGMEIIPAICPLGNSNALLWHDINLSEAVPVRELPLIVSKGQIVPRKHRSAFCESVPAASAQNFTHFPLVFKLVVEPFRQYRISFELRAPKGGAISVRTETSSHILWLQKLHVNEGWNKITVAINPLSFQDLQMVVAGDPEWILEIEPPTIEDVAFFNVVRRAGAPLTLRLESGEALTEMSDFSYIKDTKSQEALREYRIGEWHEPPQVVASLPEDTLIRANYYHVNPVDSKAPICLSEPKSLELIERHFDAVHRLFRANQYLISCDEIRTFNWCRACAKRDMDSNSLFFEQITSLCRSLHTSAPQAQLLFWSDMFDRYHNSLHNYYCIRGSFDNSYKALSPDMRIVNWNFGESQRSIRYFADNRNRMVIAGYYDGSHDTRLWVSACKPHADFIDAFMYTTWTRDYSNLEAFSLSVERLTSNWS
jgi:hypothetical protein